jgi:glycine oxidase
LGARDDQPTLRGVKGEIIIIETPEVSFNRPVRLLHPRYPIYIIPRTGNLFLIGATSIENEDNNGVTVRSGLELLSAAYSLHPAFGEALIVELNSNLRPAYPDNLPHIEVNKNLLSANGLYRHGYLLAPKIAQELSQFIATGNPSNRYSEIFEVAA